MVVVVESVGVAELRIGAELPELMQQQRHPPHDDVGGRWYRYRRYDIQ